MLTVVIAEKEHIDSIHEYDIFLKPFINSNNTAFCEWNTEGRTLEEAVPSLMETVSRQMHWRAVILCDERGLEQKNPFEIVPWKTPEPLEEEPRAIFFDRVYASKKAAYEAAAEQPLTRLMTFFCVDPESSWEDHDPEPESNAALSAGEETGTEYLRAIEDADLVEYNREARLKKLLRRAIIGDKPFVAAHPEEIYCVAKRTYSNPAYDLNTSWTPHYDLQYSQFYDWNLYFDKMRYLVFDMPPKNHQNYTYDYIRYLCAVLLLIENGAPQGVLSPNRVYNLDCVNDETALRRLMVTYDARLRETSEAIENEVRQLSAGSDIPLTDGEVKASYCTRVTVPVRMESGFDANGLFANKRKYGLSTDCPDKESVVWQRQYRQAQDTFYKLMKQPRRSLARATERMRGLHEVDLNRVKLLNHFQVEDVDAFVGQSEHEMIAVDVPDIFDYSRYEKQMEKENKAVKEKIETRMHKRSAVLLGALVLVLTLLAFVPLILNNTSDSDAVLRSLLIALGTVLLTALAGLICLFVFRGRMRRYISHFNGVMEGILRAVEGSLARFSRYLSCACGFMRGSSVLNFYNENDDRLTHEIRVRKMHVEDIRERREILNGIFGSFMTDLSYVDPERTGAYLYDFSRQVEFEYPLPLTDGMSRRIGYLQDEYEIAVPVDFIRRVTVRLEELYE